MVIVVFSWFFDRYARCSFLPVVLKVPTMFPQAATSSNDLRTLSQLCLNFMGAGLSSLSCAKGRCLQLLLVCILIPCTVMGLCHCQWTSRASSVSIRADSISRRRTDHASSNLLERHSGFVRSLVISKRGLDLLRLTRTTSLHAPGAM